MKIGRGKPFFDQKKLIVLIYSYQSCYKSLSMLYMSVGSNINIREKFSFHIFFFLLKSQSSET